MASTYSSNLRFELMANGDQSGTWGATTNTNLGTLIEGAISGRTSVTVTSASQALTIANGATDQARMAILNFTGSFTPSIYIPPVTKTYIISNNCTGALTLFNSTVAGNTTAAGKGITINTGETAYVYSDGTNCINAVANVQGLNALTATSAGGNVDVTAGTGGTTSGAAGNISVRSGSSSSAAGGSVLIIGGNALATAGTSSAGAVNVFGGTTTSTNPASLGGAVNIQGGGGGSGPGGTVTLTGGTGVGPYSGVTIIAGYSTVGVGPTLDIKGGESDDSGAASNGGAVNITGGIGTDYSGVSGGGGAVNIKGGPAAGIIGTNPGTLPGGDVTITGGSGCAIGGSASNGGSVSLVGGPPGTGATGGGNVNITAVAASGNTTGGNVVITAGGA